MNEYGGLIEKIGRELNIKIDTNEDTTIWEARVVYSVMGKMAIASLFDVLEDGQPVSIIHFKRRVQKIMQAYLEMYPKLLDVLQASSEDFANEIYNIYLNSGCLYHTPNRIMPVPETRVTMENIEIIRGAMLSEKLFMSGLGNYSLNKGKQDVYRLMEIYQIPSQTLVEIGNNLIHKASWEDFNNVLHIEYLRIEPPYSRGYWKNTPNTDGEISLLRVGEKGGYIYYLYKYDADTIKVSELPTWMVRGIEYRNVANCILAMQRTLPPLKIEARKENVLIKQDYLLPPQVFNFMKLYSWPLKFYSVPSEFERIMQKDVFEVFRNILEIVGIEVNE